MNRIEREYQSGLLVREIEFTAVADPTVTARGPVIKADAPDRYLLNVVYPAMQLEKAGGRDGYRDFAGERAIEVAAWRFMMKGAKLGMWHQDGHDHCADVVESYIYRNPDPWIIKDEYGDIVQEVCKGDWCMGTILQPQTWALYEAGAIGGVSPQGVAARRYPSPERLAELRS